MIVKQTVWLTVPMSSDPSLGAGNETRQVAFKFTPFPALPRCLSNKIITSLLSKQKPARWNLTHFFHLWFVLVCSVTHYGICLCVGELSPVTYDLILSCWNAPPSDRPTFSQVVTDLSTPSEAMADYERSYTGYNKERLWYRIRKSDRLKCLRKKWKAYLL